MYWIEKLAHLPGAKMIFGALLVVALGLTVYFIAGAATGEAPNDAYSTVYICSETGKTFRHTNQMGEEIPILSPYSGQNTGYVAERCYWNADGTIKKKPTYVLLNSDLPGKENEPTFCPDCGRLVVGHNPAPDPNNPHPPPTRDEWMRDRDQ